MSEHRIVSRHDVLDGSGRVAEAGYAFSPLLGYDRNAIKTSKLRIKEWDYYMVSNDAYSVAFTLSDHYYMGLHTIGVIKHSGEGVFAKTLRELELFPMGKYGFKAPGEICALRYESKRMSISYAPDEKSMMLDARADNFFGTRLQAHFRLWDCPRDSMVIVTPFDDKRYFYYNLKTNCIRAQGYLLLGEQRIDFNADNSFAVYDCGRGAWTLKNKWYWATSSAQNSAGCKVGINIGYGFGDTSAASENMVFVNGKAHKLGRVTIEVPKDKNGKEDCCGSAWKFTEEDGRLELTFLPAVVRTDKIRAAFIYSKQRQTFGRFIGYAILDDGKRLDIDQSGSCEIFDNNG